MLALLSPITGLCVYAVGGRRVLIAATVLFGAASIGCYLAFSLQSLVIWRAIVGIALSGVLVSCDALLGIYFHGALRERWIGIQMIVFCAFTIFVGIVAGALGDIAWRTVFLLGATGLLMLPAYLAGLQEITPTHENAAIEPRQGYPWRASIGVFATTILLAYLTFAPLFNAGFILQGRGINSGVDAGIALALSAVGSLLPRLSVAARCAVTGGLAALAFLLLGLPGLPGVLACMCVIGMALGFGFPPFWGGCCRYFSPRSVGEEWACGKA